MRNSVWAYLFTLVMFLWPAMSHGEQDWSTTFEPTATASYLPPGNVSLMVVPAGLPSPERDAAARALLKGLSDSGHVGLVLDHAVLGEVGEADDPSIVARCANLQMITHVAVLRLLNGTPSTALITIYAKSGGVALAGFVAIRGTALSIHNIHAAEPSLAADMQEPGEGVSSEALQAADSLDYSGEPDASAIMTDNVREENETKSTLSESEAQAKYDMEFVGYSDIMVAHVSQSGLSNTSHGATFWVGRYKRPLEGTALYRTLGRHDLAERYNNRNSIKWMAYIGSIGLAAGGAYLVINSINDSASCFEQDNSDFDACREKSSRNDTLGWTLIGASVVPALLGALLNPHPVSVSERRRLAEEHNMKLREELGLTASTSRSESSDGPVELHVAPVLSPSFQGVALEGRF